MTDRAADAPAAASAELGVVRVITAVLAATTVLFFALTLSALVEQYRFVMPYWQVIAASAIFGLPLMLAAAAPWCTLRALRFLHGTYAVIFALVVLSWFLVFTDGPMPTPLEPWTVGITALSTVPAALAWRPAAAWVYLVASSVVIAPTRIIADGAADVSLAAQFTIFTVTICAVFTAATIVAMSAGRQVDIATAAARTSSMRAAALTAQVEEQAQLDALVHDEVIGTIFAAAGAGRSDSSTTRVQAERTLTRLSELRDAAADIPAIIQPNKLIASLTAVVTEIADATALTVTGERQAPIPAAIASAVIEATSEALRNSRRHAAPDLAPDTAPGAALKATRVERAVFLHLSPERVEISVRDDGRGFDLDSVPANRLGIAVSILGRIDVLPGAHASVWSRPGQGTRVSIGWHE
jgi:hypothetical protein